MGVNHEEKGVGSQKWRDHLSKNMGPEQSLLHELERLMLTEHKL